MKTKRIAITVCAIVVFFCLAGWLVLPIYPTHGHYLDVYIIQTNTDGTHSEMFVVVSNSSKYLLTYNRRDDVKTAWRTNNGTLTNDVGHFFQEIVILGPSRADKIKYWDDIPLGATSVSAGIRFVGLTWKSQVAFRLPHSRFWRPIRDFMFSLDTLRKPEMVWSDALRLK
jgi:hypothetical protein